MFHVFFPQAGGYYLVLVDHYCVRNITLPLMVVEIFAFSRIYGVSRLYRDVEFMLDRQLCLFWAFCWGFLVPAFLSFIWIYFTFFTDPLAYKNNTFPESYLCKLRNIFDRELALAVLYVCFRLLLVLLVLLDLLPFLNFQT